mmetsp:Transcript_88190/g.244757  ORF Transcript_88190/g.244757 Transcript_88190/m.244757 type:complete len:309 (-) Transcript_88190:254-1180(-)
MLPGPAARFRAKGLACAGLDGVSACAAAGSLGGVTELSAAPPSASWTCSPPAPSSGDSWRPRWPSTSSFTARMAAMSPGSRHISLGADSSRWGSSCAAAASPPLVGAATGGATGGAPCTLLEQALCCWASGSAGCEERSCSAALASAARLASARSSWSNSCCRCSVRFCARILSRAMRSAGVSGACERASCVRASTSPLATRLAMSFDTATPQRARRSRPGNSRVEAGKELAIETHSPRRGSNTRWCQNTATTFWNLFKYSSFVQDNFSFHFLSRAIHLIMASTDLKLQRNLKAVLTPRPLMWTSCSL